MADKADVYAEATAQMQSAEDEICERTLARLEEYANAMGITIHQAMLDVIPSTRERLKAFMARRIKPAGFAPFRGHQS